MKNEEHRCLKQMSKWLVCTFKYTHHFNILSEMKVAQVKPCIPPWKAFYQLTFYWIHLEDHIHMWLHIDFSSWDQTRTYIFVKKKKKKEEEQYVSMFQ